jgi:hypothetical protein
MTTNPLNQHRYAVNVTVTSVGWITDREKTDVTAQLDDGLGNGDAIVYFTSDLQQLRLYWQLLADSMDDALREANSTLRSATAATGVTCPQVRSIHVDEIGHQ